MQQSKSNEHNRALKLNTSAWQRLRLFVLDGEPLCRLCRITGRLTAARAVDHIDDDPSNNDLNNLQALCISCHSIKTADDKSSKKRFNSHGYPIGVHIWK